MHAVIVSNGFPPTKELLEAEIKRADLLIGADGGGNTILRHGITPDVVIGDMDSFQKPEIINFEMIRDLDQETNDLEKALSLANQKGSETCTVLGAFGRRMDHSLKNISVLKKFNPAFQKLLFVDEMLTAFLVENKYTGELPAGSIVSLFPLSGNVKGITTKGLKYPLSNESLENGRRDGTSNETVESEFSIEIESGDLVVFVERE
ncbi:MAG: thiamine diphosphokinase [Gracilimonas sp.]